MATLPNPPIIVDQGDDGVVAITTPTGLSLVGVVGWDLLVGLTRGGVATATYSGAASTIAGLTTITWNIPSIDLQVATPKWAIARVRYASTKRTFYRSEFQILPGFSN